MGTSSRKVIVDVFPCTTNVTNGLGVGVDGVGLSYGFLRAMAFSQSFSGVVSLAPCRVLSFTSTDRSRCITSGRPVAGGWLSLPGGGGALDSAMGHEKVLVEASGSTRPGIFFFHTFTLVGRSCHFIWHFFASDSLQMSHMYSITVFDTIEDFEEEMKDKKNQSSSENRTSVSDTKQKVFPKSQFESLMGQQPFHFTDILNSQIHVRVDQRPLFVGDHG
jgi:hypothetical protein